MTEEQNEPGVISPFSRTERRMVEDATPEGEARSINPFVVINRGEDTVDPETEAVVFADFSPSVLPADAVEDVATLAPKEGSAPGLAPSSELQRTSEQSLSETPVPAPAETGDGTLKPSESSKQTSSTDQRNGQSEQPV